jgi:hypothetical protein
MVHGDTGFKWVICPRYWFVMLVGICLPHMYGCAGPSSDRRTSEGQKVRSAGEQEKTSKPPIHEQVSTHDLSAYVGRRVRVIGRAVNTERSDAIVEDEESKSRESWDTTLLQWPPGVEGCGVTVVGTVGVVESRSVQSDGPAVVHRTYRLEDCEWACLEKRGAQAGSLGSGDERLITEKSCSSTGSAIIEISKTGDLNEYVEQRVRVRGRAVNPPKGNAVVEAEEGGRRTGAFWNVLIQRWPTEVEEHMITVTGTVAGPRRGGEAESDRYYQGLHGTVYCLVHCEWALAD